MKIYFKYSKKYKIKSSIVNISSIVADSGFKDLSGYASTKGALQSLTKCFAVEKANFNIRANLVNPGFIKTSFYEKFRKKKDLYKWTLSRTPMGRWGKPDEVADLICFLISDQSSYINGEVINIDGGWTNA
jgi:NAD(P)-dependent dehydrogenase (short-subunit alcohol dehydrogenase family)